MMLMFHRKAKYFKIHVYSEILPKNIIFSIRRKKYKGKTPSTNSETNDRRIMSLLPND